MLPPLFSYHERQRLNQLIGHALCQPDIRQRLLSHDEQLIVDYTLTQRIWHVIHSIQASTLQEFCQQLVELETEI